jgi:hypothetical protein|tara:strand:+ start:1809 stop:2207 length:399 start_codon:yes stop_codon:yes gene_type:complete
MPADTENTRFWPRVGLYVDKTMAEEFIERMVGHGSVLDNELDEFVQPTIPDAMFLQNEVDDLFEHPFEEQPLDEANQAILDLMTFEGNRKDYIKAKKAEGMSLEDAKEDYKQALDLKVKAALPENFVEGEEE